MKKTVLILPAVLTAGCISPDGPFTAAGKPAMALREARPHCKEEARSVSDDGTVNTNWSVYEGCMADLGWVRQPPGSSGGSGPTGGGQPSY